MTRAVAVLVAAAALCCGPAELDDGTSVSFDLYVSAAALADIGQFQLSLRRTGGCQGIERTRCLKDQIDPAELVSFTSPEGRRRAVRVAVDLTSTGEIRTQDVTLAGVPVGKGYALIVEALTRDAVPRLLDLSCTPGIDVERGQNTLKQAQPIDLPPAGSEPAACDPSID